MTVYGNFHASYVAHYYSYFIITTINLSLEEVVSCHYFVIKSLLDQVSFIILDDRNFSVVIMVPIHYFIVLLNVNDCYYGYNHPIGWFGCNLLAIQGIQKMEYFFPYW